MDKSKNKKGNNGALILTNKPKSMEEKPAINPIKKMKTKLKTNNSFFLIIFIFLKRELEKKNLIVSIIKRILSRPFKNKVGERDSYIKGL